jgi:anti-anti-sigma factor
MSDSAVTSVERRADHVAVRVLPEVLDDLNIATVRANVEAAGKDAAQLPVMLDLGGVKLMVSLALGEFVVLAQHFQERGQRLVLTNLQPTVRQLLAITRLDKLFEVQDESAGRPN